MLAYMVGARAAKDALLARIYLYDWRRDLLLQASETRWLLTGCSVDGPKKRHLSTNTRKPAGHV